MDTNMIGFRSLFPCALDESSLSIGRVKLSTFANMLQSVSHIIGKVLQVSDLFHFVVLHIELFSKITCINAA